MDIFQNAQPEAAFSALSLIKEDIRLWPLFKMIKEAVLREHPAYLSGLIRPLAELLDNGTPIADYITYCLACIPILQRMPDEANSFIHAFMAFDQVARYQDEGEAFERQRDLTSRAFWTILKQGLQENNEVRESIRQMIEKQ